MIPFVQQLFAQRYGLRKLLMNATWGDRRHIRVSAPVEAIGKSAGGPNLPVGFWKVTLNRVHLCLRFEFCRGFIKRLAADRDTRQSAYRRRAFTFGLTLSAVIGRRLIRKDAG